MEKYLTLLSLGEGGWGMAFLVATGMTIALTVCIAPLGFALGLVVALMQRSKRAVWRWPATVFSSLFRSLPELLTLFIVYFGLHILLEAILRWLGYQAHISINAFFAGVLALALVAAAFASEVWLGALQVIDRGQWEAARALSLSRYKTFRAVLLPQALKNALPMLANNWLTVLKDTSLVSTIALVEIMRQSRLAAIQSGEALFFFGTGCALYLLLSALSDRMFRRLEKYSRRYEKAERTK